MQVGKPKKDTHRNKQDPFYQSKQWKTLVKYVWQRDMFQCMECKRKGILKVLAKPASNILERGTVDHIKPRIPGSPYNSTIDNQSNCELLCYRCHASKSSKEKKKF